jgi:protein SCO1/2
MEKPAGSDLLAALRRAGERVQTRAARWAGRPIFWVVFVGLIFSWPIARTLGVSLPPNLPVLGELPAFELTSHEGRPFRSEDLKGRAWVANFIFTRCPTVCPKFSEKMAEVQHRSRNLGHAFQMVSFTADPEYDTPEKLAEYAKQYRASRRWSFVTGPPESVRKTVVDGLKVSMGKDPEAEGFLGIFHGTHFVLVDTKNRIRGYYDSNDQDAIDRMLYDAGLLLARGG